MSRRSITLLVIVAIAVAFVSTGCDWKALVGDIRGEIGGYPPVADAGGDLQALAGIEVELNGTASYDPDNDPLTYLWKVVGWPGGYTPTDADVITGFVNRRAYFTPPTAGKYDISLTVTDPKYATEDTIVIEAVGTVSNNLPPVAQAGPDLIGVVGNALSFDGSNSYDPDSGDSIASWSWDFGDGSAASTVSNPSHTYTIEGPYTVTLTVTDTHGLTDSDTAAVEVSTASVDHPPTAIIGANYRIIGDVISLSNVGSVQFNALKSYDPDGDTISAWDWRLDGTSVASTSSFTHNFSSAGKYIVALTVTAASVTSEPAKVSVVVSVPSDITTTFKASGDITVAPDSLLGYAATNGKTNGIGGGLNLKTIVPIATLTAFDLSKLAGKTIVSAMLNVGVVAIKGEPLKDTILAVPVIASWTESTTTFKVLPYNPKEVYAKTTFADLGGYRFDVSKLVAGWVGGDIKNLGVALIPSQKYDGIYITSARESGDAYIPTLTVTYR